MRGTTEDDIWKGTGVFLHTTLKIPADEVDETRIEYIRRMRTPRLGRIKDELLVIFNDLETRDCVAGYA